MRADGISFAIIRLGYRGTESGAIQLDERFRQNLLGAQMAGLNIGVYFYSQATTVAEAEEEADFVLSELGATQLVYPVVFDFEPTGSDGARISGMSADEMFAVAKAFCDRIAASGRTAMLYGNYYDLQDMEYTGLWQYGYWLASIRTCRRLTSRLRSGSTRQRVRSQGSMGTSISISTSRRCSRLRLPSPYQGMLSSKSQL